ICAKYMKETGQLKHNTVVSTVMSNLGFYKALEANNITSDKTAVGDRYVMEEMKRGGYNLGGEQSGHIILLDYITTGDGMLSALQLVNIMKMTKKPLSELAGEMTKFPQLLVNVRVTDKKLALENEKIKEIIRVVEEEMNGDGRILVRPSGTEPLIRVMAEAPTQEVCDAYVHRIVEVVKAEVGAE
ncbi:phosphoglucosamine mutase, partial [Priestia megaterium]|nr:phosphoglucosamine mutase [Priestia megaterium]